MEDDSAVGPTLPKQKRTRTQLNCTYCRQGKLKCDRNAPCDQCIKRNRGDACGYMPPPITARNHGARNVQRRIRHLERLVVDLMNPMNSLAEQQPLVALDPSPGTMVENGVGDDVHMQQSQGMDFTPPYSEGAVADCQPVPSEAGVRLTPDGSSAMLGQLKITKHETSYVGSHHWASIMESIHDLKREIEDEDDDEPEVDEWHQRGVMSDRVEDAASLGYLLRAPQRMTREELLQALPSRTDTDKLIATWFQSPDPFKSIIHGPQFQSEYRQFWTDPRRAPITWLALLYAVLTIGSVFLEHEMASPGSPPTLLAAARFHSMAAAALALANYTAPKQYVIEALILYIGGTRMLNGSYDVWLLQAVALRLAIRMGYHRDPSQYSNISAFAGEMRRRQFAVLCTMDAVTSFQYGLPGMMRAVHSDTKPVNNFLDSDFGPETVELPPSRPSDETTPVSHMRAKADIARSFSLAVDLSHAIVPPPYSEILELDARLESARAALPPLLQWRPLDTSLTDAPEMVINRLILDLLYLKTKTVLHRRFMLDKSREYSHTACVNAAMQSLRHHQDISVASARGGQLHDFSWYMATIGTHDFLLASMIICLELFDQCDGLHPGTGPERHDVASRQDMIDALERSKAIFEQTSADCWQDSKSAASPSPMVPRSMYEQNGGEMQKACKAMTVMLAKVKERYRMSPACGIAGSAQTSNTEALPISHAAALASSMQGILDQQGDTFHAAGDANATSAFANWMDVPADIDWTIWDTQLGAQQQVQKSQQQGQHQSSNPQVEAADWSIPGFSSNAATLNSDSWGFHAPY